MKFCIFALSLIAARAESLHYSINWPSGLSLGEATVSSERGPGIEKGGAKSAGPWRFAVDIDASVPGFVIRDHYHSAAGPDLCSTQLDKATEHGKHKNEEKTTFDQQKNTITRETTSGGKTDITVSSCTRDALTYLQFVRSELAQGRVAPPQMIAFGALYQASLQYMGTQTIRLGEKKVDADRTVASIKGPSSDLTIEIFFARDAARTPLMARIPLSLGTFTAELQQ